MNILQFAKAIGTDLEKVTWKYPYYMSGAEYQAPDHSVYVQWGVDRTSGGWYAVAKVTINGMDFHHRTPGAWGFRTFFAAKGEIRLAKNRVFQEVLEARKEGKI